MSRKVLYIGYSFAIRKLHKIHFGVDNYTSLILVMKKNQYFIRRYVYKSLKKNKINKNRSIYYLIEKRLHNKNLIQLKNFNLFNSFSNKKTNLYKFYQKSNNKLSKYDLKASSTYSEILNKMKFYIDKRKRFVHLPNNNVLLI
uniref:Uncharacterized protein n=1 Tax=Amorphochlora amoebiformis TaxID=1561963 RepID=A0A0H5BI18_9EUKA|nr:hypothetical protein [Amorphochlora amoebiformis]